MAEVNDDRAIATNGSAQFTLDELAMLHEGLGRFMLASSERMRRCYHAALARNMRLAKFQLAEAAKSLRYAARVRPRYAEAIDSFLANDLAEIRAVIDAENWAEFDGAWERMTIAVNKSHEEANHGYLIWHVSPNPPEDLDLKPRNA